MYTLSANPSREELRDARRVLKPLALCKYAGAKEQLALVDLLLRTVAPRTAAAKALKGPAKPKRRYITAGDCMGVCPACAPLGARDSAGVWVQRASRWPRCPRCAGTGKIQTGMPEIPWPQEELKRLVHRRRPMRGEWAQVQPLTRAPGPMHTPARHQRGYALGEEIGAGRAEAMEELDGWPIDVKNPAFNVFDHWTTWPRKCDGADLSAALEAAAVKRAKDPDDGWYPGIVGRRLVGRASRWSGREKQQAAIRQLEKAARKREGVYRPRPTADAALKLLAKLGVDVDALMAQVKFQAHAPEPESAGIIEAMRRGDLPPDPKVPEHRGQVVRVTWGAWNGSILDVIDRRPAHVVRRYGLVEHTADAVIARCANGEVEAFHADDVVSLENAALAPV